MKCSAKCYKFGMELQLIRPGESICAEDTLSDGSSMKFRFLEGEQEREAFIIRYKGEYHAYKNRCAHMALTLDLDDNDFFTVDFRALICKTHGAMYNPDDGYCFAGPCYTESLEPLRIEVRNSQVILVADESA